jgi:uncharacterized phiE125 gp8 family phage protein
MRYTRTPIGTAKPFDLASVKAHMRVEGSDEDTTIDGMGRAAAMEIEAYCDLALITQTITTTTDAWPGQAIALPVGPVAPDTVATVSVIEADGTATPVTDGFWLEGGRYPVLHFTSTPGGRLRIVYVAGYGADAGAIPADLSLAIADQALRYYDRRGDDDAPQGLCVSAARICARYRRVKA